MAAGSGRPGARDSVVVAAVAGLPSVFAFGGRSRLLDDAVEGVPFMWRGDRRGVSATAPVAGTLLALTLAVVALAIGFAHDSSLARGRRGDRRWIAGRGYERLMVLDLTALEHLASADIDARQSLAAPRS